MASKKEKIVLLYKILDNIIELSTVGYQGRYKETINKLRQDISKLED